MDGIARARTIALVAVALLLCGRGAAAEGGVAALLADRFGEDAARRAVAAKRLEHAKPDETSRKMAWEAFSASPAHRALREEWEKRIVSTPERTSPYLWRHVGTKPPDGWALVIAMHGGGGAPKQVNDREWSYMFSTYYREHPEAGGYVYLALRAPNDTWNGFYDDAICPLVENLIEQFVLFDGVDPDQVYVLGASHGGYGAFVIGPKIPYRFAAIHAAASAPTDGETMGENLRDVRFTYMVGEKDTAYGRAERDQKFAQRLEEWRRQYGGYSAEFDLVKDTGHLVPDHDQLAAMLKYRRDPLPKTVVWTQSDSVLHRFYWIEAPNPVTGGHVEARVDGNTVTIATSKQDHLVLWLDEGLVDLRKPVTIRFAGQERPEVRLRPRPTLETYCQGLEQTADPRLAAPVRIEISGHLAAR